MNNARKFVSESLNSVPVGRVCLRGPAQRSCKVNTSVEEKLRTNERSGCSELGKLKQMEANVLYLLELDRLPKNQLLVIKITNYFS